MAKKTNWWQLKKAQKRLCPLPKVDLCEDAKGINAKQTKEAVAFGTNGAKYHTTKKEDGWVQEREEQGKEEARHCNRSGRHSDCAAPVPM